MDCHAPCACLPQAGVLAMTRQLSDFKVYLCSWVKHQKNYLISSAGPDIQSKEGPCLERCHSQASLETKTTNLIPPVGCQRPAKILRIIVVIPIIRPLWQARGMGRLYTNRSGKQWEGAASKKLIASAGPLSVSDINPMSLVVYRDEAQAGFVLPNFY